MIEKFFKENPELKGKNEGEDFLIFVLHEISPHELDTADTDDLLSGIVEGAGDLGIDAMFVILNGRVLETLDNLEKEENNKFLHSSNLKVLFFQTKKGKGFDEKGLRKSLDTVKRILDLDTPIENLRNLGAEEEFLKKVELIRKTYEKLIHAGVTKDNIEFKFFYITQGDKRKVNKAVQTIIDETQESINDIIIGNFSIKLLGIDEIISLTQKKPTTITLEFISPPIEIETPIKSYIGVINAEKLLEELLDTDKKSLNKSLFEDNVRHFLGLDRNINKVMKETAINDPERFWYYNNGITMIADKVENFSQKKYKVENPQVVNGLQTIYSLYEAQKTQETSIDKIHLTLRLIEASNTEFKMRIISYTNSQNKIEEPSLKAIDEIHKLVEQYLKQHNIYYERRLNFYKSQGIKGVKVIDIKKMARILWSIYQKEAIFAFNDPKKLFTDEEKYRKIFPENTNISLDYYLFASKLYTKVWSIKRSDVGTMKKGSKEKRIFSSGSALLLILNIISSMMFKKTRKIDFTKDNLFKNKRKIEKLLQIINDDKEITNLYSEAKEILIQAIENYQKDKPGKNYTKDRKFDAEYLLPLIENRIKSQKSKA